MKSTWEGRPTRDIYSYGLLVWQIAKDGDTPFYGMSESDIDELKNDHKGLDKLMGQLGNEVPRKFEDVILATTCFNPDERASLEDVREMMKGEEVVNDAR